MEIDIYEYLVILSLIVPNYSKDLKVAIGSFKNSTVSSLRWTGLPFPMFPSNKYD